MTKTSAAGVNMHNQLARVHLLLQFNEMIAAAETAELQASPFRFSFAAPGRLPIVVDRNAMSFGPATNESRAVFFDVVFSPAAHQIIKLSFAERAQPATFATGAHGDPGNYRAIKLQPLRGCGFVDMHSRFCAHHAAADVIANRPHWNRPVLIIGKPHPTDGNR